MDQGISISLRCVVTWGAFVIAVIVGGLGLWHGIDALTKLSMVTACLGMTLVILSDNAKTRRLVWRLAQERAIKPDGVRPMR